MAIVATMAVVKSNCNLLAATVDLSAPGAAAAVAVACCRFGYFRGTNHGIPAVLADAMEAGPGTMAFLALPHDLAPSYYCTPMEIFRLEDESEASILFFPISISFQGFLEQPEHRVIRFGSFAELSAGGFPLEHWTEVGIRTAFRAAIRVCSVNLACLSGYDYFTVCVMVKLEHALDVPLPLLLRYFSGNVAMPIGVVPACTVEVEEDGLSVSSGLYADSVKLGGSGVDYESMYGLPFMGAGNELSEAVSRTPAANQWPIGISGRRLSITPQPQAPRELPVVDA